MDCVEVYIGGEFVLCAANEAEAYNKLIECVAAGLRECGWMKSHDREVIRSCVPVWEVVEQGVVEQDEN